MSDKVHVYTGREATVAWDASRCIHAAECVRCVPASFDVRARPWIQPDNGRPAELAEAVNRCPSGALSMHYRDGTSAMAVPPANTCFVNAGGPYYFRGRLDLARFDETSPDTRMALCRCGKSQNKPFCDNSHRKAGFADPGTLPWTKAVPPDADSTAPLTVRPSPDGPLQCSGPLELRDPTGRTAFANVAVLCRCGGSASKPYCDGTHARIGFKG